MLPAEDHRYKHASSDRIVDAENARLANMVASENGIVVFYYALNTLVNC